MNEWGDGSGLTVGDTVVVIGGGAGGSEWLAKLDGATPTILRVGSRNFNRINGRERGGDKWHGWQLERATPERIAIITVKLRRARLIRKLKDANWQDLTTSTLDEIAGRLP
jgi:hypothetical protein